MEKRKSFAELDYFNAAACLFVILIHVLSIGITSLEKSSLQMAVIYLPWKLAAYVVPGFLFTGALKMALGFGGNEGRVTLSEYGTYMWRRIVKIYLPYVVWVGVYYLYFLRIGWVESGIDVFLEYVYYGNLSSPFYYVVTVMQFYALMPLWKWMMQKIPFWAAILTSAIVTLGMLYSEGILSQIGIAFPWRDRVFPSYLIFWVLGLYVGTYYDIVRETLKKHIRSVLSLLVPIALYGFGSLWQYAKGVWLFDGNVIKMFTDCMTICVILTLCILLADHVKDAVTKPLGFIYRASFTVYLSHCLFLQIITSLIGRLSVTDISVQLLLRAAVCYTAPFVLWYVWDRIRKGVSTLSRKRKAV